MDPYSSEELDDAAAGRMEYFSKTTQEKVGALKCSKRI